MTLGQAYLALICLKTVILCKHMTKGIKAEVGKVMGQKIRKIRNIWYRLRDCKLDELLGVKLGALMLIGKRLSASKFIEVIEQVREKLQLTNLMIMSPISRGSMNSMTKN